MCRFPTIKTPFKNAVLRGTIILTTASIISRVVGFFYRIFLTRAIGAEGIGLIQLSIPVVGISFAICSAGIQTAISKFCAAGNSRKSFLLAGICVSLPLSILFSWLTYINADFIASKILMNSDCTTLIKMLSLSIPFSSLHNCICGYYFGLKKSGIPAISQLLEQAVRISCVAGYAIYCNKKGIIFTPVCAVIGTLVSEIITSIFCLFTLRSKTTVSKEKGSLSTFTKKIESIVHYSLPLTSNRLLMHLLQSGETILIPAQLIIFGYSKADALGLYGVLTGMALPMILFPTAITNSLSVMLLPDISEKQFNKNENGIKKTIEKSIWLCVVMGFISTFIFLVIGGRLGSLIFNDSRVGTFVMILAWICPFIYLITTLGSILNGLGFTTKTCIYNIIGIIIRITALVLFVPKCGIYGYLIGMLVSQIVVCALHLHALKKTYDIF